MACAAHFALDSLEFQRARLALAVVDELDRGFLREGTGDDGLGVLADRLVDIIFAVIRAADRPFEADFRDRAGAQLYGSRRPRSARG